jgi:hypothetical protein
MRFIDLSAPISPDPPELPDVLHTDIAYEDHATGAAGDPDLLRRRSGVAARRRGVGDGHVHAPGHAQQHPRRRALNLNSKIAGKGVDAWGWDAPLQLQAEQAKAEGRPGIFWAAHQVDPRMRRSSAW